MRMLAGIAACFVVCCTGCGGGGPVKAKLYPVTGKVTVAGKPLTDCSVIFTTTTPATGAQPGYQSVLGPAGEYELIDATNGDKGAAPAKYKVTFVLSPEAAKKAMMQGGGAPGGPPGASESPFPKEYASGATSPKEVEVKAESNVINIDI